MSSLGNKFRGCLMGLAIGDGCGRFHEGVLADVLHSLFKSREDVLRNLEGRELLYTDDTQMAIGVAEALTEYGEIEVEQLCGVFAANYQPFRGYAMGARRLLETKQDGGDWRTLAETQYPGGSYGNGAAMRVAPLGIFFHNDLDRVMEQSRLSALPTHVHPLGIEGAQLVAVATALAARTESFDRVAFFRELLVRCVSDKYREQIGIAAESRSLVDVAKIGNGISAMEAAPAAIACFSLYPASFRETIAAAIWLGGDTDTIAAMAGGISGALLGIQAIPPAWIGNLENGPKGRDYVLRLSDDLYRRFDRAANRAMPDGPLIQRELFAS